MWMCTLTKDKPHVSTFCPTGHYLVTGTYDDQVVFGDTVKWTSDPFLGGKGERPETRPIFSRDVIAPHSWVDKIIHS
jgi:hypothetical protein